MSLPSPKNKAYQTFAANLSAARSMVEAGRSLDALQVGKVDTGDLYRGAWIQAVAALDYFMHQEIKRRIKAIAQDPDRDRPQAVNALEVTLGQAEDLRTGVLSAAEVVVTAIGQEIKGKTIQQPDAISRYLRFVTDGDVWAGAARFIRENSTEYARLGTKELKGKLAEIVRRRNIIAHQADIPDSSSDVKNALEANAADQAIALIELVVLAIDNVLGEVPEPAHTPTTAVGQIRHPPSTWLINEHGALEEGTELELAVDLDMYNMQDRLGAWLAEDPARTRATWTGTYPYLRWAADGNEYSPSGLVTKMFALAEQKKILGVQGPAVWRVPGQGTLAEIAKQLRQQQED